MAELQPQPAHGQRPCSQAVTFEHLRPIFCGKPAIVVIDRREFGALALCKQHMDSSDVYQAVKLNGWEWRVIDER